MHLGALLPLHCLDTLRGLFQRLPEALGARPVRTRRVHGGRLPSCKIAPHAASISLFWASAGALTNSTNGKLWAPIIPPFMEKAAEKSR